MVVRAVVVPVVVAMIIVIVAFVIVFRRRQCLPSLVDRHEPVVHRVLMRSMSVRLAHREREAFRVSCDVEPKFRLELVRLRRSFDAMEDSGGRVARHGQDLLCSRSKDDHSCLEARDESVGLEAHPLAPGRVDDR